MSGLCETRIIRDNELAERLGVSRVTIWRWEREGQIPKKHVVGPNVVGWLEHEIEEWWAAKTAREATGDRADDQTRR